MARTFLLIATSLRSLWSLGLLGRHKITKSQGGGGSVIGVIKCDKCDEKITTNGQSDKYEHASQMQFAPSSTYPLDRDDRDDRDRRDGSDLSVDSDFSSVSLVSFVSFGGV